MQVIHDPVARARRSGLWALKRARRMEAYYLSEFLAHGIRRARARRLAFEMAAPYRAVARKFYRRAGRLHWQRTPAPRHCPGIHPSHFHRQASA